MQKINCEIKGLTPYYFNKYVSLSKMPKGEKAEKELAMAKVYCHTQGLFFPGIQIQGSIVGGIKFMKMKLEKSMVRAIEYIERGLSVHPYELLFTPAMTLADVELVKEPVQVTTGKQIVLRENWFSRITKEWSGKFMLEFPDFLPSAFVKEALETGGAYCGIGGRRNWKRGRFEVVEFIT